MRFRNLISDFAKDKIVILSTHIVSDVSYIADTILMMKDGKLFLQEPMATVTDSINGKVWELLVSDRETVEYSSRFSVVNLHHENGKVRLRMIHEIAPVADAMTVSPSLEDLFLYHFGEEAGIERMYFTKRRKPASGWKICICLYRLLWKAEIPLQLEARIDRSTSCREKTLSVA